MKGPIWHWVA